MTHIITERHKKYKKKKHLTNLPPKYQQLNPQKMSTPPPAPVTLALLALFVVA